MEYLRDNRRRLSASGRSHFAMSGPYLYFGWNDDLGDIWVMDVVTDESE